MDEQVEQAAPTPAPKPWMRPGEVAFELGIQRDGVGALPLDRMDVRSKGAKRPQWRYSRASVEKFKAQRTEAAGV